MTDSQEEWQGLQRLLDRAADHFAAGSKIWNAIGLDSPQFATSAAQAALREYQESADLLESSRFESLSSETQNRISANRELALAHIVSLESFLYDQWNDKGIKKIIELVQQEIDHTEKAVLHLELAGSDDIALLSSLRTSLHHRQGRRISLSARLASREGRLIKARDLYRLAEDEFRRLMEAHEARTPELATIRDEVQENVDHRYQKLPRDTEEEEAGVRWTARILQVSEQSPTLSDEDLYRRAASNYYVSAAMRSHLDAFEIMNRGGSPQDADKKLEESIELIYSAMEVFPQNLEFHQDLFNVWRARGELFGCPLEETEEYYHSQCPLAILHHIGSWYVSPAIEYESLSCTVCGKDILECAHYPGQTVGDNIVRYRPQNPHLLSVSLVDVPEDPGCRIEWISIPKSAFPSPPEDSPGLRCFLCRVEKDEGKIGARLIDLPEWIEKESEKRYQQIKRSGRFRWVDVRAEES